MTETNAQISSFDQEPTLLMGGSRRWQQGKTGEEGKPLITIITSTYNAARDLHWTIDSIRAQTYPYIQWIVADGGSTDGTVDLLRQNEDIIDIWFSAPDKGIYDAWNKALKYLKGEWVQFIGAGDELAEAETLAKVAPYLASVYPAHDIVYGRLAYISEGKRQLIEEVGMPWEEMKGKWEGYRPKLPIHPEVFHHASTFDCSPPFDISYRIAGDSHFLMRQLKKKDFMYMPVLVDRMPLGGISGKTDSFKESLRETRRASRELGFSVPLLHVVFEGFKYLVKYFIVLVFGNRRSKWLYDLFRKLTGKKKRWGG